MTDLRNAMISLEREVNALKKGRGPYMQSTDMPKGKGKRKNKSHTYDIPGSSRDQEYMNREVAMDDQWPHSLETMGWTTAIPDGDEAPNTDYIKTDVINKAKHETKTSLHYDDKYDNGSNYSKDKYTQKTNRSDIKIIENKQLVPPRVERVEIYAPQKKQDNLNTEFDMTKEWNIVTSNKKTKRNLTICNKAISNNE